MKSLQSIFALLFILAVLSAGGAKTTPFALQFDNPYAPQSVDSHLMAGDITVD